MMLHVIKVIEFKYLFLPEYSSTLRYICSKRNLRLLFPFKLPNVNSALALNQSIAIIFLLALCKVILLLLELRNLQNRVSFILLEEEKKNLSPRLLSLREDFS